MSETDDLRDHGDLLRSAIASATLAPSTHNAQPWLWALGDDVVELRADRTRALAVADPEDRELTIGCGAALFNCRLALRALGHQDRVTLLPDPGDRDLLARIRVGEPAALGSEDAALFAAVRRRHSNRLPFAARPVPPETLAALRAAAAEEGARLHLVEGGPLREALAVLVALGDRAQTSSRAFRRELGAWTHADHQRLGDGMPGYAFDEAPEPSGTSRLWPPVMRSRAGETTAPPGGREADLVHAAPVLAVLASDDDTPLGWLCAGQALERVLLRACADQLAASFLNPPLEIPALRERVATLLGDPGAAHCILRFGYAPIVAGPGRRDVEEVIV